MEPGRIEERAPRVGRGDHAGRARERFVQVREWDRLGIDLGGQSRRARGVAVGDEQGANAVPQSARCELAHLAGADHQRGCLSGTVDEPERFVDGEGAERSRH